MALEDEEQPGSVPANTDKCGRYGVPIASGSLTIIFGMLAGFFARGLILDYENNDNGSAKESNGTLFGASTVLFLIAFYYLLKSTCGSSIKCSASLFNHTQPGTLPYTVQDQDAGPAYGPAPD